MANTPNLDLVKPAGTDHALVSVINSNSDKIDGGFGTLSEQIGANVPTQTYNGNLNDLVTPGWYILGSSVTNPPPTLAAGKLHVEKGGETNYVRQTYYCGYDPKIYTRIRYYSNGWVWTAWQEVTNSEMAPFFGGDKQWITNAELNSYQTTGIYMISNGSTIGGVSSGLSWFMLIVFAPRSDTLCQIVSENYRLRYREYRLPNGWSDFKELATKNNTPTTVAVNATVPKNNGTVNVNYSSFGTFTNGHSYLVTVIGNNPAWSYSGILFFSGSATKIVTINNAYIEVTVDGTKFTLKNLHTQYDQVVTVEVVGKY